MILCTVTLPKDCFVLRQMRVIFWSNFHYTHFFGLKYFGFQGLLGRMHIHLVVTSKKFLSSLFVFKVTIINRVLFLMKMTSCVIIEITVGVKLVAEVYLCRWLFLFQTQGVSFNQFAPMRGCLSFTDRCQKRRGSLICTLLLETRSTSIIWVLFLIFFILILISVCKERCLSAVIQRCFLWWTTRIIYHNIV